MKKEKLKSIRSISVKEYAKLIGKSNKTVYKMIKDGFVEVKRGISGYEVEVDAYMLSNYKDINKHLMRVQDIVKVLEERINKLEEGPKKNSPEKEIKPVKAIKKVQKNSKPKSIKKLKPLKNISKKR